MRYIYYCEKCGFVGSAEAKNPKDASNCSQCGNRLVYTGLTRDEYVPKTQNEKDELKIKWAQKAHMYGSIDSETLKLREKLLNILLTTGYSFEGYKIIGYNGIVSGEVVMGTGFLSEFEASINDFFGGSSDAFAAKMSQAKEIATQKMIEQSIKRNGNAILGIDFNYTTFGNNMIGVSANGTSVIIEIE